MLREISAGAQNDTAKSFGQESMLCYATLSHANTQHSLNFDSFPSLGRVYSRTTLLMSPCLAPGHVLVRSSFLSRARPLMAADAKLMASVQSESDSRGEITLSSAYNMSEVKSSQENQEGGGVKCDTPTSVTSTFS